MNSISVRTEVAYSLLNFADLPEHDRIEIDDRIERFQREWGTSAASSNLADYCANLPHHVRQILQRELMIEDYFLQHQKLDQSLYATYRQQMEPSMVETLFVERLSTDSASPGTDADPIPAIHGYEIQEPIGKGGFAIVYKAVQLRFDRVVAIKVPIKSKGEPDPNDRRRFYDEARLQAKYLGAGVPAVFACSFGDFGVPYIAMEYIDGQKLDELFPKQQPDRKQCIEGFRLIAKVCRALEPLHRDNTLHLDLSAGNVYLDSQGNVKILDFGFGYAHGLKPIDQAIVGTPDYMAPEKAHGAKRYRPATDVFSLGVFLMRMATGQVVLPGGLNALEKIQRLRDGSYTENLTALDDAQRAHNLPEPLIQLTKQCLALDPEQRPEDAGQLADRIEQFFKQEEEELQNLQVRTARQKAVRQGLMAVVGVFGLGLLCSLGFGIWANVERQRAQRNMQLRIDALDTIVRIAASDTLQKAGQPSVQRELLVRLIGLVDDAARSEKSDVASREQKALALNAMTIIQQGMQQPGQALETAIESEKIGRELCKSRSASSTARMALGVALSNQASLQGMSGQLTVAIQKASEASELFTKLAAENATPQVVFRQALVENAWANCLKRQAEMQAAAQGSAPNYVPAELHYRKAIEHVKAAINLDPLESQYRVWLTKLLSNFALLVGDRPEGLGHAREAVRLARELNTEYPNDISNRESLAVAATNEGCIALDGAEPKPSEAVAPLREALDLYLALLAQVPMNTEFVWGTAMAHSNYAAALIATDINGENLKTAMEHLQAADKIYQQLIAAGVGGNELQQYIDQNNSRMQELNGRLNKPGVSPPTAP